MRNSFGEFGRLPQSEDASKGSESESRVEVIYGLIDEGKVVDDDCEICEYYPLC